MSGSSLVFLWTKLTKIFKNIPAAFHGILFFLSIAPFIFILLTFERNGIVAKKRNRNDCCFRQYFAFLKVSFGSNKKPIMC